MSNETRKLPTRPGAWYAQWEHDEPSDDGTLIVWVQEDGGRLLVHLGGLTSDLRAFRWLAPIPGPAVLAALAEYGDAILHRGPKQGDVNVRESLLALDIAIRAERDGAS